MNAGRLSVPVALCTGLVLGLGAGIATRPKTAPTSTTPAITEAAPIGKSAPAPAALQAEDTPRAEGVLDTEWAWADKIRSASAEDMPALLQSLEAHPDTETHRFLRRMLLARWHELDPAGAMRLVRSPGNGELFHDLYRGWASRDMDAAMAFFEQLEGYHLAAAQEEVSMAAALHYSFPEFMEWTKRMDEGDIKDTAYRVAFDRFARDNLPGAVAALDDVRWKGRFNAVSVVADVYAETDPLGALAWAKSLDGYGSEPRELAIAAALKRIAVIDPDLVASEAVDLAGGKFWRGGLLAKSARHLYENESPAAAAEFMKKWLPEGGQRFHAGNLIARHGERDFGSALELVQSMGDGFWENLGYIALPTVSEPDALLANFDAHAAAISPAAHSLLREKLVNQWADHDFNAAVEYALANIDPSENETYMRKLFNRAANPLDAWEKSAALPEDLAATVRGNALRNLIVTDAETANTLFNGLPEGAERDDAARTIVSRLSQFGPMPAWEWTSQLEEGNVKSRAYETIAAVYAEGDPAGASEWIDALPKGASRDRAIAGLTGKISRDDPEGAFLWSSQIVDPSLRNAQLFRSIDGWAAADPAAARRAIRASNFDRAFEKELLDRASQAQVPSTIIR